MLFALVSFILVGCQEGATGQAGGKLDPRDFQTALQKEANPQLIDVRTPGEFADGHIAGAVNMDINSGAFQQGMGSLDKSKPVFVYCLSGGRSSSAASALRQAGFKTVYEMPGIIKWRNEGLPLETGNSAATQEATGMSMDAFNKLVAQKEYVLVDYNAVWCKPCKILAPIVEKIADERKDKMVLVKIDADENPALLQQMGIDAIPVLQLYHNGKKVWENRGLIDEAGILKGTGL